VIDFSGENMQIWLQALPMAAFAGAVAIGATMAIERWGGTIGGLLGTIPSTIIPASLGLYMQSPSIEAYAQAMDLVPAGMLLNVLFLFAWRIVPPRLPFASLSLALSAMTLISLSFWLFGALILVRVGEWWLGHYSTFFYGLMVTFVMLALGIWSCVRNPPSPKGQRKVGLLTLLARGLLAAGAIALTIYIGAQGDSFVAGVVSVFPAIFLTTMASLWVSQGRAVPAGAIGPMMLGANSISVYALIAHFTLPALGLATGALLAWLASIILISVPAWLWLR
tara:strand:+ start:193 stop:1032 length:840 start_codon:yes stop_codon:yes gene_type:complete